MKKTVLERSFVAVLFVLVIVIFSFAERDTKKLFELYNTKSTVELPKKTADFTAENFRERITIKNLTRN